MIHVKDGIKYDVAKLVDPEDGSNFDITVYLGTFGENTLICGWHYGPYNSTDADVYIERGVDLKPISEQLLVWAGEIEQFRKGECTTEDLFYLECELRDAAEQISKEYVHHE